MKNDILDGIDQMEADAKARRRNTVERTNHSLRLEGQERDSLSEHAAELWINGEITLEEKTEMVMSAVRAMAKPKASAAE